MIGIGISTFEREGCLRNLLESIHKYTDMSNVKLYIARDLRENRKGVAKIKNECLRELKDCEHIFLLDDDVKIIKGGWIEFFTKNNATHSLYLNDKIHNFFREKDGIRYYHDCGGVFMYIHQSALNKVGAFDEKYHVWGFEHCDWSIRYMGAKIFIMKSGTENYIYSEDYSNPNHKSSISDEEKQKHIKDNWDKFFKEPIKNIYIPL